MAEKKQDVKSDKIEREYVIPLRPEWRKVSRYKRTNKAVKAVKEFLARHMKVYDRDLNKIKVDKLLNEALWSRGIKHPATKIKVRAIKDSEGIVRAELAELPAGLKFKKTRFEKRDQKAREIVESKKSMMTKLKETAAGKGVAKKDETTEETVENEKKEETKSKEAATAEAEKKIEKEISKAEKHTTKPKSPKQEKNQQTGYNAVSRGR